MANILAFVGLTLICTATLLDILALSLNFWERKETVTQVRSINFYQAISLESHWGLWKVCTNFEGRRKFSCLPLKPNTEKSSGIKIVVVRTVLFLAIFLQSGAAFCILLRLFVMKERPMLTNLAWKIALSGGAMSLAAFAVYITLKVSGSEYMVAFYLAIVAWILAWGGSGFAFGAARKDSLLA